MSDTKRPYFLWDYDLTEEDVRRILRGKNQTEKIWMMSRILASARYEDVWKYVKLRDVVTMFPKLRMRPEVTQAWVTALTAWGYHIKWGYEFGRRVIVSVASQNYARA